MVRRIIAILLLLACVAATAVVWVVLRAGGQGEGEVERWIGQQLLAAATKQLNPALSFGELDYQYPTTVVVKDLRLTADDPRVPAGKLDVIAAGQAVLTLAELPTIGKPIVVESISLYRPAVRLVRVDHSTGGSGFAGISGMVKRNTEVDTTQPSTQTAQQRLKEALSIHRVELIDGRVEYDPRIDNSPPMVLDQITALLQITQSAGDQYRIQTSLGRKPIVDGSLKGLIDLETLRLTELDVRLLAELGGDKLEFLPPDLQQVLKQYEATGQLQLTARGEVSLAEFSQSKFDLSATLASANASINEYQFPVKQLDCRLRFGGGRVDLQQVSLQALQGEIDVTGTVMVDPTLESPLNVIARDVDLKELVETAARSDTSLSGTLNGSADVQLSLQTLRQNDGAAWPSQWGSGTLEVTRGTLMKLPVIGAINEVALRTLRLGRKPPSGRDRLSLKFRFVQDRIQFDEMLYSGDAIAGRGNGQMGLSGWLDLRLNAGPVEKMQSMLGKTLGGLAGKLTDSVAGYRVGGTMREPQVSFEVAPGIFGGR